MATEPASERSQTTTHIGELIPELATPLPPSDSTVPPFQSGEAQESSVSEFAAPGTTSSKTIKNRSNKLARSWQARNAGNQTAVFSPRDFVTFGLPYKQDKTATNYTRRNGPYEFIVTAPQYDPVKGTGGVPWGQDRLVIIFLTTLFKVAGSPKSNVVSFLNAMTPIDLLALPRSGNSIKRFVEATARVHGATYLAYEIRRGYRRADRYQLLRRYKFWIDRETAPNQYSLRPNILDLDPRFAEDIRKGAIPFDLETARALKNNLPAFDLYTYQAHRSYLLHQETQQRDLELDIFGESGLLAQIGSKGDQNNRPLMRQLVQKWHSLVLTHWPNCPNKLIIGAKHKRERLIIRPAMALTGTKLPSIPGVRVMSRDEVDAEFQDDRQEIGVTSQKS